MGESGRTRADKRGEEREDRARREDRKRGRTERRGGRGRRKRKREVHGERERIKQALPKLSLALSRSLILSRFRLSQLLPFRCAPSRPAACKSRSTPAQSGIWKRKAVRKSGEVCERERERRRRRRRRTSESVRYRIFSPKNKRESFLRHLASLVLLPF